MTKRMIDADALLDWIDNYIPDAYLVSIGVDTLKKKIKELTIPAPEPQESVNADALDKLETWLSEHTSKFDASIYSFKQTIKELSINNQPQESIFDADGWCWDMDLAPHNGCHLLMKNYDSDDFFIVYDCYKNIDEDYWRSHSLPDEAELWNGFKTDNIINNNGLKDVSLDEYEEVAFQLLPKLPTGGKE